MGKKVSDSLFTRKALEWIVRGMFCFMCYHIGKTIYYFLNRMGEKVTLYGVVSIISIIAYLFFVMNTPLG